MPENPQPAGAALKVFYSYSHKDEKLRGRLEEHLSALSRQGIISEWHDRRITAGSEWAGKINEHLKAADIILLLISSSFLASDYCYDVELKLALERHRGGESRIIPVILRPCDWAGTSFGELQALPKDGRPVTKWSNRDDAFTDVVSGIRRVVEELNEKRREGFEPAAALQTGAGAAGVEKCATASLIPRPPFVGFVARRDESGRDIIELLGRELAPDRNQLVAIWGPGGVGKSTLAAEFVRATEGVFDGRVAWVGALGRAEFGLTTLLDEIATQLGREDLRKLAPEPKVTQVGALISGAATLVVLDNFETISAEEQARCLDFLAQRAACPALITTRSRVDRDEVYNVPLAAMMLEEAHDFLGRLVERTRKPSNFDRLDRDELIRRCEANPLVLQWVVKQIDLAKRPQDVLGDLTQGEGDAAERVFTRSFNLPHLGDDGRATLLALALFKPDASRDALAEVAGFGTDLRRLNKAVEKLSALWLVETTEGNERLFLRGLTRGLAGSRLAQEANVGEYLSRYVGFFIPYAEAHQQPTPEGIQALEVEKDNLLAAIDVAFKYEAWQIVVLLHNKLYRFLVLRGYWDVALRSGEQAVAAARAAENEWDAVLFIANMAMIRVNRGEFEEAERAYREALEFFRENGSEPNVLACLHQLGVLAQEKGDPEAARRLYEESLAIGKKLDNKPGIANSLHQLGRLAHNKGEWEEARRLYGESLDMYRSLGDQGAAAGTLTNLALISREQGNLEDARQLSQQALEIHQTLGDQLSIALTLNNLGLIEELESHHDEAARLFREALHILEPLGSPIAAKARNNLERVTRKSVPTDAKG